MDLTSNGVQPGSVSASACVSASPIYTQDCAVATAIYNLSTTANAGADELPEEPQASAH